MFQSFVDLDTLESVAKILAFLGAAAFFCFKAITGYLWIDLSLALDCQRASQSDGERDFLTVNLLLNKGPNSGLTLHSLQARILYDKEIQFRDFGHIKRSTVRDQCSSVKPEDWLTVDKKSPFLKLIPNEETQFSLVCELPSNLAAIVEVIVVGKRTRLGRSYGQWKTSCVSLPLTSQSAASK